MELVFGFLLNYLGIYILGKISVPIDVYSKKWWLRVLAVIVFNMAGYMLIS